MHISLDVFLACDPRHLLVFEPISRYKIPRRTHQRGVAKIRNVSANITLRLEKVHERPSVFMER